MIARAVALDSFHIHAMPPANAARRSPSPPCAAPRPVAFDQPYRHLHVLERGPPRAGESGRRHPPGPPPSGLHLANQAPLWSPPSPEIGGGDREPDPDRAQRHQRLTFSQRERFKPVT